MIEACGRRGFKIGAITQRRSDCERKCRRRSTSRRPEGSGGVNVDLELEILAFMLQSTNSNAFPSKEELLCAGRHDLVDAIISEGGWLAAGWEKKANVSSLGSGVPEIAHRPPSRQRALRSKTKAVRSSRQRRGRPKPVERRALSNDESTCENSEPNESQQDATQGRSDGENIGSERWVLLQMDYSFLISY